MKIRLPCGSICIIDEEDYYLKNNFPHWRFTGGRVIITRYIKTDYGSLRQDVYLARAIVKPSRFWIVDHIDRNPLNNRRSNLRLATNSENSRNRSKRENASSKYFGVYFSNVKSSKPWRARFCKSKNSKRKEKCFASEIDAAKAYDNHLDSIGDRFRPRNFL